MSQPLTPSLAWFVRRHLRFAEDLEIALLLWAAKDRWSTIEEVADRLSTSQVIARNSLKRLSDSGLLGARSAPEPGFQFSSAAGELAITMDSLQRLYAEDRPRLIGFIAAQPAGAIQDFADAFKLKKEEP